MIQAIFENNNGAVIVETFSELEFSSTNYNHIMCELEDYAYQNNLTLIQFDNVTSII